METVAIYTTRGTEVASRVRVASTFHARLLGLLPRRGLRHHEGLLLRPGGGIHTFGMRFAIDVLFLGSGLEVLQIQPHVRPMRWIRAPRDTCAVLELAQGRAMDCGLRAGVQLQTRSGCPV